MDPDEQEDFSDKLAILGEPRAEFAVRGRLLLRNFIVAPVLVLAGAAIELMAILFLRHSFELISIGIGLILAGIMLVVRGYRNRGLRVLVFPEGLIRMCRGAGQAMFWDEIETVWRRKTEGHWEAIFKGSLTYAIQRADGKSIHFDDAVPRLDELGKILKKQTFPHLWPRYLAAFDKGASIDFGKVRLSRRGLSTESGKLGWHEVQEIKFEENKAAISKKGKWTAWFQCSVSEIPNYHVFKALTERALALRGTQPVQG